MEEFEDGERVRVIATGTAPDVYQGKVGTVRRIIPGQEHTLYTVLFDNEERYGFWTFPAWGIERERK